MRELLRARLPRYILFTDHVPVTASGKVQTFRLRELAVATLGLAHVG